MLDTSLPTAKLLITYIKGEAISNLNNFRSKAQVPIRISAQEQYSFWKIPIQWIQNKTIIVFHQAQA